MADKSDVKAIPWPRLNSHYCYGKDLQGEGGKMAISYLASLFLQIQFFIWWWVNMSLHFFGKHLSCVRICWAKFSVAVQLSSHPKWEQNTAKAEV